MTLSWMRLRDTWIAVALATLLPCGCGRLLAQTTNLSLSSATSGPGSTVYLNLSLTASGTSPAGLEWTFTYPSSQISVNSVTVGPAATTAGKTLSCAPPSSGSITCLLTGLNTNTMASGVAAIIQLAVSTNAVTTAINVTNTVGVDATGTGLTVSGTGGIIIVPTISSVTCNPVNLNANAASSCTVILSSAAPDRRIERDAGEQQRFAHRTGIGDGSGGRNYGDLQRDGGGHDREQSERDRHGDVSAAVRRLPRSVWWRRCWSRAWPAIPPAWDRALSAPARSR